MPALNMLALSGNIREEEIKLEKNLIMDRRSLVNIRST